VLFSAGSAFAEEPDTPPAAEKRAFEVSDYYRSQFVGSPEMSPNGQLVAFPVRSYDLEEGESWSQIWMMRPDGSGLRQMTSGKNNDTGPLFSPDGKYLLFSSSRSESSQLWKMPVDGGEPQQLTDFSPGVSDPVFSPDGKYIAVTSEVYPECGIDTDCHDNIADALDEGKLNVHVADDLLYRHWTSWADGKTSHVLLVDADTGDLVKDMTPGSWVSPTFSLGGHRGYDFSPDSTELVFVSNRDADQASSTNADLWLVPLEGDIEEATATNLTADNDGWDGAPLYSPNGRYLAFLSQETPGYEADLYRLSLYDRKTKTTRRLNDRDSFDNWIDDMTWLPDSSGFYFQAEEAGRSPLFTIDLDGSIQKRHTDANIAGWKLTPDAKAIVYARRAIGSPPEIFRVEASGGPARRLTDFNAALEAEVDIRPAEEIWVDAGDYKVQVFLVKPHGFDPQKKYPLILNVHGGPQSQWADSYRGDWQVYPGKGYVVAFPNPTGSSGHGQDFVDAIGCDWGGRVFDDLMKVTDALEELPFVDKNNMGAMGWSYGGYMMMWFEGHTDRFKTLAAMMGLFDLPSFYGATEELWFPEKDLCGTPWDSDHYERWSPSRHVDNFKTPALVVTGELDYRVPYTQSLGFFTALRKKGIDSRLVVFPDAGHWPAWHEMAFYYNAHIDWFHKYLGGEPATWDVLEHARNKVFGQE
jgi:dipeptidyl aminopeptidase/acylaminoacyl peptidase